ncbi:hypothetical protein ACFSQ3_09360 [Sphingobacterium corticis]|uniref:DUF4906 domain-containing protein n=1 Tax=Sphingobacterium corticis TaxID=1812823 RepID=A0ABW5NJ60_9SPHI
MRFICSCVTLFCLSNFIASCSNQVENPIVSEGDTKIQINVSGIDDEGVFELEESEVENKIAKFAKASLTAKNRSEDIAAEYNITSLAEFDVLSDLQAPRSVSRTEGLLDISTEAETSKKASIKHEKKLARMTDGIQYRILMYPEGTTQNAVNQVGTAGIATSFQVNLGQTYDWYAVSINTTNVPNIDASGIISSAVLSNQDVLYAAGKFTPAVGQNTLNITFRRMTARIEVDVNVRGIFGRIENNTSLTVGSLEGGTFVNAIQTGDFNVRTGGFNNLVDATPVTGQQMTVSNVQTGDAVKKAIFYTVRNNSIATGNIRVRLNQLNIFLDDNTIRRFSPNSLVPISGAMTPTRGFRYLLTARLIEQPVIVGGVRWARTNLIYDYSTAQIDRYRFRPNNNYAIASLDSEYWVKGAPTPGGSSNGSSPCRQVYPEELWITPSKSQRSNLGSPALQAVVSAPDGIKPYSQWNQDSGTQPNPAYPDNVLILNYLGIYSGGSFNHQGHLLASQGSAQSTFWTVENTSGTTGSIFRSTVTYSSSGQLNFGSYSNVDNIARTSRRAYRCVRS